MFIWDEKPKSGFRRGKEQRNAMFKREVEDRAGLLLRRRRRAGRLRQCRRIRSSTGRRRSRLLLSRPCARLLLLRRRGRAGLLLRRPRARLLLQWRPLSGRR